MLCVLLTGMHPHRSILREAGKPRALAAGYILSDLLFS
jgi:hypothetical protein